MKLVHISDTHGQHEKLDLSEHPGDILIHTGDWTRSNDPGFSETDPFLEWLETQPYKHKILIAGNHEIFMSKNEYYFKNMLKMFPSITYLHNTSVELEGLKFFGSPYSNKFYDWAFMKEDSELEKIWDKIPLDTQVLLTHGPAYGCNDTVKTPGLRDPHVGSKSLAERKKLLTELQLHASGHIHECGSSNVLIDTCQNTCGSVLNEKYNLVNKPITITLET